MSCWQRLWAHTAECEALAFPKGRRHDCSLSSAEASRHYLVRYPPPPRLRPPPHPLSLFQFRPDQSNPIPSILKQIPAHLILPHTVPAKTVSPHPILIRLNPLNPNTIAGPVLLHIPHLIPPSDPPHPAPSPPHPNLNPPHLTPYHLPPPHPSPTPTSPRQNHHLTNPPPFVARHPTPTSGRSTAHYSPIRFVSHSSVLAEYAESGLQPARRAYCPLQPPQNHRKRRSRRCDHFHAAASCSSHPPINAPHQATPHHTKPHHTTSRHITSRHATPR